MTGPDNKPLYSYLDPRGNTKLSNLKGYDLQDLLSYIDEYYLDLRDELNLNKRTTFGLELEFEDTRIKDVNDVIKSDEELSTWEVKYDASLFKGAEINSPVLIDTKENWKALEKVCEVISPLAKIGMRSGGHIHIGSQIIGENATAWLHFIKLWATYENILFRFLDGEHLTARPGIEEFARPVAKEFIYNYNVNKNYARNTLSILRGLRGTRYQAVNFNKTELYDPETYRIDNTVEFRSPNGSLDSVVWQNNVNTIVKLLEYSKSLSYDDDKVEKRLLGIKEDLENLDLYDEIYIGQALELSDMIFDNNLDKIYFLKQYFKSFDINNQKEEYPEAKVFTKKKCMRGEKKND